MMEKNVNASEAVELHSVTSIVIICTVIFSLLSRSCPEAAWLKMVVCLWVWTLGKVHSSFTLAITLLSYCLSVFLWSVYIVLQHAPFLFEQCSLTFINKNKGELKFTLKKTAALTPYAQVVVYTVLPNGETVADSMDFPIEECLPNKVWKSHVNTTFKLLCVFLNFIYVFFIINVWWECACAFKGVFKVLVSHRTTWREDIS